MEVGPLKSNYEAWEMLWGLQAKSGTEHFSLKIWHPLVATILIIFTDNQLSKFSATETIKANRDKKNRKTFIVGVWLSTWLRAGKTKYRVGLKRPNLFLPELCQISAKFDNLWYRDSRNDNIMRGTLIAHIS